MNRIKELREKAGLKQAFLAKELGVTQGNLSAWETERWEPNQTALKKLADLFEVSVDYLLGRDAPQNEQSLEDTLSITARGRESEIFNNYISTYLSQQSISFREFSKRCNVPYSTLKSICENGVDKAGVQTIGKICKVLKIKIDDLFEKNDVNYMDSKDIVFAYNKLNSLGKEKVISYIEDLLKASDYKNKDYETHRQSILKTNAMPFAAADGDVTNLDEARNLYDQGCEEMKDE